MAKTIVSKFNNQSHDRASRRYESVDCIAEEEVYEDEGNKLAENFQAVKSQSPQRISLVGPGLNAVNRSRHRRSQGSLLVNPGDARRLH